MSNDTTQAFPFDHTDRCGYTIPVPGMTLRDYFAAAALQGPIAHHPDFKGDSIDTQCEWAYKYADSMLAQRNKQ